MEECPAMAEEDENTFASISPQNHILKLGQWDHYDKSQWERQRGRDSRNDEVPPLRPTLIDDRNHICLAGMQNTRYPGIVAGMGGEIGPDGNPMTLPTAIQTLAAARVAEEPQQDQGTQNNVDPAAGTSHEANAQNAQTSNLPRISSAPSLGGLERDDDLLRRTQTMLVQVVAASCRSITPPPPGHGRLNNHPQQQGDEAGPTHDRRRRSPQKFENPTAEPWPTVRGPSCESHFLQDRRTGRSKRKSDLDHEAQIMREDKMVRSASARSSFQ